MEFVLATLGVMGFVSVPTVIIPAACDALGIKTKFNYCPTCDKRFGSFSSDYCEHIAEIHNNIVIDDESPDW